jgi:predicted enzyme involved in methoxymalonyl-ACP biosynthesis
MSCRVIGLGVEDTFRLRIIGDLAPVHPRVTAKYIPTDRNGPARNLLPTNGFKPADSEPHAWELTLSTAVL